MLVPIGAVAVIIVVVVINIAVLNAASKVVDDAMNIERPDLLDIWEE